MDSIFKFGGASIKTAKAILNLKEIVTLHKEGLTLVVVSAIDKTTNKLEEIWKSYQNNDVDSAIYKTNKCIDFHYKIINLLLLNKNKDFVSQFDSLSNELKFFISGNKKDNDLSYSKIVSYGELWSTVIISHYLNSQGIKNKWVDARELIQTETAHVESKINWSSTNELIQENYQKIKILLFHRAL